MRHKQQPTKSSRHKSLTFIIDSHTSFGNQQQQQQQHNNNTNNHKTAPQQSNNNNNQSGPRHSQPSSCSLLQQACISLASQPSSAPIKAAAQRQPANKAPSIAYQRNSNQNNNNQQQPATNKLATKPSTTTAAFQHLVNHPLLGGGSAGPATSAAAAAASMLDHDDFEHNDEHMRHMSSVMRLAFLENNDIPLEDCTSLDFNSMSTASLLQKNIQQQLLHERRDLLKQQLKQQQLFFQQQQEQNYNKQQQQLKQLQQQQLRQQKQQQQLLQQQQQLKQQLEFNKQQQQHHHFNNSSSTSSSIPTIDSQHHHHHPNHHEHDQHLQLDQQELNPIDLEDENDDDQDHNLQDDDQDYYDVSESTIFATATPISSSSAGPPSGGPHHHANIKNTSLGKCSTPKANNARNLTTTTNITSNQRTPKGSARTKKRTSPKDNPNNTVDSHHQVSMDFPKLNAQVDTSCGGFLCDEQGCGKSFPSVRKLRHHKVVHSDEFPFVCEFNGCGKKFKRKFGIDLHSTTHFDLDPHMYKKTSNHSSLPFFGRRMQYSMCKPCGQKFKTVHEYQYHMLKHGKEPFRCPVKGCGQTFGIWKSFQKHRASHYFNYFCKMDALCDHQTSNLQLLKLHIYCCHFRRKLPETSTMAAMGGEHEENSISDDDIDIMDEEVDAEGDIEGDMEADGEPEGDLEEQDSQVQDTSMDDDEQNDHEDKSSSITIKHESPSIQESPNETEQSSTMRRDCRLRRNPPRSTTFGQDYATINNGGYTKPTLTSSPGQSKSTRFQIQLCASGRSNVVKKKENSSNRCKLK